MENYRDFESQDDMLGVPKQEHASKNSHKREMTSKIISANTAQMNNNLFHSQL